MPSRSGLVAYLPFNISIIPDSVNILLQWFIVILYPVLSKERINDKVDYIDEHLLYLHE
jgi:hypothetical protein